MGLVETLQSKKAAYLKSLQASTEAGIDNEVKDICAKLKASPVELILTESVTVAMKCRQLGLSVNKRAWWWPEEEEVKKYVYYVGVGPVGV